MSIKASNWLFGIILVIIIIISILATSCEKVDMGISDQITDVDGNVYHSVIIGNQEWMVENLKATRLNDGTELKYISSGKDWITDEFPSYCWYDNIINLESNNGLLYNFYAVNTGNLAPIGWHVATDEDWRILELFIGMTESEVYQIGWRGDKLAIVLKAIDKWKVLNGDGDNYGFKALPSGARSGYLGDFFDGINGVNTQSTWGGAYWWASTSYDDDNGWFRNIVGEKNEFSKGLEERIFRGYVTNQSGFSVRCVKNN